MHFITKFHNYHQPSSLNVLNESIQTESWLHERSNNWATLWVNGSTSFFLRNLHLSNFFALLTTRKTKKLLSFFQKKWSEDRSITSDTVTCNSKKSKIAMNEKTNIVPNPRFFRLGTHSTESTKRRLRLRCVCSPHASNALLSKT